MSADESATVTTAATPLVVQLEYRLNGDWAEVVRFDYDPEGMHGHDVTEESVHMDVYRDREKLKSQERSAPRTANESLTSAEEHLNRFVITVYNLIVNSFVST